MAGRLRKAGDGRPRLFPLRNSLVQRDPALAEALKPTCTEEELDGYVWRRDVAQSRGDEPVKEDDHGADAMRYVVAYLEAPRCQFFRQEDIDAMFRIDILPLEWPD